MKKFSLPAFIILIAAMALGLLMIQKCEPDTGMYRWEKVDGKRTLFSGDLRIGFLEPELITGVFRGLDGALAFGIQA